MRERQRGFRVLSEQVDVGASFQAALSIFIVSI